MIETSRRTLLRTATATAHADLERRVGPLETRTAYIAYVRGLEAFRAPLERALTIGGYAEGFGAWRPVFIADALAADLADLGVTRAPRRPTVALADRTDALGALYVLGGSALGARLIAGLAARLGYTPAHGARHLDAQTASIGNFRAFIDMLAAAPGIDDVRLVAAANATFRAAAAAFDGALETAASHG